VAADVARGSSLPTPSLPSPLPSAPCQGCVTPIVVAPGQPSAPWWTCPVQLRDRRLGQKRSQVIEGTGTGMVAPAPLPQKGSLSSLGLARFIPARDIGAIRAERRTQRTSLLGSCPTILDAWRSCAYDHSPTPATPTTRRKLPDVSEILEWNHQRIDRLLLPERPPSGRPTPGTRGQAGVHGGLTPRTAFQTGFRQPATSTDTSWSCRSRRGHGNSYGAQPTRVRQRCSGQATAASRTPVCGVQGGVVACRVRASRTHEAGTLNRSTR
jgi:hypothetical protein